jgi:hypothetical protein
MSDGDFDWMEDQLTFEVLGAIEVLLLLQKMNIADKRDTADVLTVRAIGQWDTLVVGKISFRDSQQRALETNGSGVGSIKSRLTLCRSLPPPIGSRVLTSIILTLSTLGVTGDFGNNVGGTLVGRHEMGDSGSTSLARGCSSDTRSYGFQRVLKRVHLIAVGRHDWEFGGERGRNVHLESNV